MIYGKGDNSHPKKLPIETDKIADKQKDVILFPRKVEEAKQRIAKYGLPNEVKKK